VTSLHSEVSEAAWDTEQDGDHDGVEAPDRSLPKQWEEAGTEDDPVAQPTGRETPNEGPASFKEGGKQYS